jgi:CheY-like chemotaxis protein
MSHEIRTPLTSIIGYAESLKEGDLPEADVRAAHETIMRNGKHLLGVINDILDLSKIEAGKLDIELIDTPIFDLIGDVENLMQHRASERGLALRFEYKYPLPASIRTDPLRLKQILINLVGNAIKFTEHGSVRVVITADPGAERMRFAVIDTGIGLSEEQRARLFQAFSQADTSTTRKFGGTGLGLIISAQLAEKLGGGIELESFPGKGSTFALGIKTGPQLELRSEHPAGPNARREPAAQGGATPALGGNVLLVEDGRDNQRFISFVLKKAQVNCTLVENGALALEAVANGDFDLILMDMQMPVMDGYTATRTLRERGCTVPIIALTANTMKQDVQQCLAAGCTDFLGKPFERKAFYAKLSQYLSSKAVNGATAASDCVPILPDVEDAEVLPIILEFVGALEEKVAEMGAACRASDCEKVAAVAHRLRSAGLFGYPMLGDAAGVIEDIARAGALDGVEAKIDALRALSLRIKGGEGVLTEQLNRLQG